jgi:putative ABC transport system substrate-binding protein
VKQTLPVIGYLSSGSPETDQIRLAAFLQGLGEIGYVEGQKVTLEYRWARGDNGLLPALAADLIARQVTTIAAIGGTPPALAAKAATTTIPIVFSVGDPIEFGLVTSLNRPGGNITGVANLTAELAGKRLELLHELAPGAGVVALLLNPTNPATTKSETEKLQDAARLLGLKLQMLTASTASEIDDAFASLVKFGAGAVIVSGDPFFTNRKDQIVALAARYAVPAIYIWREFALAGGLMRYGNDLTDGYRIAGAMTGKILRRVQPADLPVQQAVRLSFVINLKTAEFLGLTVPPSLLARADEVIE